ncbi:MAG: cell division protein FtsA [Moraxella sp.]|nr:cell division protein FtsA [Moraxella sp.]
MKVSLENLVVIHLTATAIYTVVGCVSACGNKIQIKAVGIAKSEYFVGGRVTHREKLVSSIKQSVRDAEEMANVRIYSAGVSFATPELISNNRGETVEVLGEKVDYADMARVLSQAKTNITPENYYVVHHSHQFAWLDDGEPISDAIGLTAKNLAVSYHLMSMPTNSLGDIYNLFQSCNIHMEYPIFDVVSSAEYALMAEEKQNGVCLIDIGTHSTSICVYKGKVLVFTACIPMGGSTVTTDIARELNISMAEAERLKRNFATLNTTDISKDNFLDVTSITGEKSVVSHYRLVEVAKARYDAIFDAVQEKMFEQSIDHGFTRDGVVLTGGASSIKGIRSYLKRRWQTLVHISNLNPKIVPYTQNMSEDNLKYLKLVIQDRVLHTAFGAMIYATSEQFNLNQKSDELARPKVSKVKKVLDSIFGAFKNLA